MRATRDNEPWSPGGTKPVANAGEAAAADGRWELAGYARVLRLQAGLHALIVGKSASRQDGVARIALPVTQILPRIDARDAIAIVSSSGGANGWLGAEGGTVVLRAAARGGTVFVATYGVADEASLPTLRVLDLDRLAAADAVRPAAAAAPGREIPGELVLHIERQGDRRFPAGGWAGNPGGRLRIEGFAVRPLQQIAPGHVEYMAFGPGGRQTPWVSDVKLCGTRGRGLPLTGFAVRLAPALRHRFDVVYEGYFFDSGVRGPVSNGAPCLPSIADDPLGAIRLRVVERPGA